MGSAKAAPASSNHELWVNPIDLDGNFFYTSLAAHLQACRKLRESWIFSELESCLESVTDWSRGEVGKEVY